jgi:hypothetical protein
LSRNVAVAVVGSSSWKKYYLEKPMQTPAGGFPHSELIGTFRQFGLFGIPYQVLREGRCTDKGWTLEIEVPETGERLEYPLDAVLDDPEAR